MKKHLMAVSAAALMASPLAVMAGDLNIYGQANGSADFLDDGNDSSQYLANRGSRLGITGSEYLGMGLTGLFQFEVNLSYEDVFGNGRESFAGLQGNFGTVLAGQLEDPLFKALDGLDLFADRAGSVHVPMMARPSGETLHSNALAYATPDFGGFSGVLVYGPEQGTDDGDRFAAQLQFDGQVENGGNVTASLGYLQANEAVVDGLYEEMGMDPTDEDKLKVWQFTAGYEMTDVWRAFGFYQDYSARDVFEDDKVYGGGIGFMVSPQVELLAQLSHYDADMSDADRTVYAFGADYFVTDRTTFYGIVGFANNDDNVSVHATDPSAYGSSASGESEGLNVEGGEDPWIVSVGVQHNF